MAGTTRLELATSAVTVLRELVLQLTTTRGLPNTAEVVQDIPLYGSGRGLEICWKTLGVARYLAAGLSGILKNCGEESMVQTAGPVHTELIILENTVAQ